MGPEERANQSVDVVTQLRRTGRFALWIGVFEIVVIPIYYYVAYLIPNITQVVLIGVIAIIGAYQFVTGLILVVQGRKLELASLAQLKTLRRPLRWVTAIVIVFIIFAVVNAIILLTEGASGGAVGILSLLLLGSVSQSRRALKAYEASPDLHLQTTATLDPQPTQPLLVIVIIVTVLVVLGTMIVTLKPKPAQRLVENKAYLAAIKQATNDNADSNQTNNQGPQIVADGQHAENRQMPAEVHVLIGRIHERAAGIGGAHNSGRRHDDLKMIRGVGRLIGAGEDRDFPGGGGDTGSVNGIGVSRGGADKHPKPCR